MRRDLIHYWRTNLPVTLGAAVATAVLAGALIVGDSVRGSLRQLTLERLGGVDQALAGQRFFPVAAAERFAEATPLTSAPAILLQASAQHGETKTRASGVGLTGADERFFQLFGENAPVFAEAGGLFPPVVINQGLADTLGAAEGDTILFSLKRWTEVPSGSLLSKDDTASVVETVRLEVQKIIPDAGLGAFGLAVHQSTPYNAFVPLPDLQRALDQEGSVNAVLAGQPGGESLTEEAAFTQAAELDALLRDTLTLDELGLRVIAVPPAAQRDPEVELAAQRAAGDQDDVPPPGLGGYLHVESGEYVLRPPLVAALTAQTQETGATLFPALTYLANALRSEDGSVPYSTVTAFDAPASGFGELRLTDGTPAPTLAPDDILVGAWAAERLGTQAGDELTLDFYTVGPREELLEGSHRFTVAGIVELEGLGADSTLSQEYPGIAGTADMSEWDPPFPVDLDLINDEDEAYWDLHRDTPKAFVGLAQGQDLWRTRWGQVTAFRVAPQEGTDLATFKSDFETGVKQKVSTAAFGLTFQPVKALGLGASGGATDFGGLFIGLSMFVIASAALLVALLFGLAVEQRVGEVGLRLAVGFEPRRVRRLLIAQGLVLAAIGGVIGLVGAYFYAELMMYGLRTWWLPAVGTSRLELFLTPVSLVGGFVAALLVVLLTIVSTVRRIGKIPAPLLLKQVVDTGGSRAGRASRLLALVCLSIAGLVTAFALATGIAARPELFFLVGPLLLVGLLAFFAQLVDRSAGASLAQGGPRALLSMAVANTRRNRRRSLYSTTLVAFATFMIVTVAAFEEGFSDEDLGRDSGAGGYQLVAQSDVPLSQDLGSEAGRFELGLDEETSQLLEGAEIMPFRLVPGDDTSCLNLYQPGQPRLLGVSKQQRERGGFSFKQTLEETDDPWSLLESDLGENVLPVIGDANSTQWILKLPLGEELTMENERGEEIRLRLVANLATSVFQSELLISEENLLHHFPNRSGFPYFLIETDQPTEVAEALERDLSRYGFDAITSAEKLSAFHAVQNTYLATFRVLGGLGLLLGTIGLAVVLVRNVLERRGELAALRAFGFRRRTLFGLVLGENLTLLVTGLVIGCFAALATAAPHVIHQASAVPWGSISGTLGLVFAVGAAVCFLAARGALRSDLIPALKAER